MTTTKELTLEAQKNLEEIDRELANIKTHTKSIQHDVLQRIALPLMAIPLGIGYAAFSKSGINKLLLGNWLINFLKKI